MLQFSPPLLAVPARALPAQLAPAGGCAACNSLFFRHGANASVDSVASVDVVVSACSHSLAWLPAFVEDVKTQSAIAAVNEVVVYAKCGTPPDAPPEARLVALPNVGRCDHTWAHHLSAAHDAVADVTFFVKDTYDPGSPQDRAQVDVYRGLSEVWDGVRSDGFVCAYDVGAHRGASIWHDAAEISAFKIDNYGAAAACPTTDDVLRTAVGERWAVWDTGCDGSSSCSLPSEERGCPGNAPCCVRPTVRATRPAIALRPTPHPDASPTPQPQGESFQSALRPLGAWLKNVSGVVLNARRLWPVCYGGNFAAARRNVQSQPQPVWAALRDSLARADNLEEGHYAERSWAGLLSPAALPDEQESDLLTAAVGACRVAGTCLAGQLMGCDCARADGATPADYDPAPDGVASACHPAEPVSCGRYDGAVTKFGGWKGKRFAVV